MRPPADTSDTHDKAYIVKRYRHKLHYALFVCLFVFLFVFFVVICTLSDIFRCLCCYRYQTGRQITSQESKREELAIKVAWQSKR